MVRIGSGDEEQERRFGSRKERNRPVCDPGVVVQRVGNARGPGFVEVPQGLIERRFGLVERDGFGVMRTEPLCVVSGLGRKQRLADHEVDGVIPEVGPVPA